jgi:hypothetical protein
MEGRGEWGRENVRMVLFNVFQLKTKMCVCVCQFVKETTVRGDEAVL